MDTSASMLERPLPKPGRSLLDYASARILEALLEAIIALEFLEKGYTRNAAGKTFQAWRALTAAILALEKEKVSKLLRSSDERRWLEERAIPRLPTTRLRSIARLVEATGYPYYTPLTDIALNLHDYQYHGPDPDLSLSRYRDRGEAAADIIYLLDKLATLIEEHVEPKLEQAGRWSRDHSTALNHLKKKLESLSRPRTI